MKVQPQFKLEQTSVQGFARVAKSVGISDTYATHASGEPLVHCYTITSILTDYAENMQQISQEEIKKASCFKCRRSKIKCVRDDEASPACRKCLQAGTECVTPEYHVGRYKGSKKYVPLRVSVSCA